MEISATYQGEQVVFKDFSANGLNFLIAYVNSRNELIVKSDSVDWSRTKVIATNVLG